MPVPAAADDVFMDVPSFDDADDDGGARRRSVEKAHEVETKRRRGEDRDARASGARVKKAWERTDGGGDEGRRTDARGSAARLGKGEKTKTSKQLQQQQQQQQQQQRKSGGVETAKRKDGADDKGDDGEKKVSGRVLGRRRRAAEKRKRLAEAKRAAKREDAASDGYEKRDKKKQKQKKREEEEEKTKEMPPEDVESSDYDEELLPEKPVILAKGDASSESESEEEPASSKAVAATKKSSSSFASSYMEKMRAKLSGGQFRMLNERLYTTTGEEGLALVKDSPELFEAYHAGFRSQVESWPTKPVHVIAKILQKSPKNWIVADFGCGDAELSRIVQQKCHSFDLQTPEDAPEVVACNMSDVPLSDASVDCAVFSLSLMGTDYGSFLEEAHRVLKPGGLLWIAEVRSRFDGKNGAASVSSFISALSKLGFKLKREPDERNRMFFTVELIKTWVKPTDTATKGGTKSTASVAWPPLKACSYKKR